MGIFGTGPKDVQRSALKGLEEYGNVSRRIVQELGEAYIEILEELPAVDPTNPNSAEHMKAMTDTLETLKGLMTDYTSDLRRMSRAYAYY